MQPWLLEWTNMSNSMDWYVQQGYIHNKSMKSEANVVYVQAQQAGSLFELFDLLLGIDHTAKIW